MLKELLAAGKLHGDAMTVTGRTLAENLRDVPDGDREVIRSYGNPLLEAAGYVVMSGNLFDSAVMKISVIDRISASASCRNPDRPNVFEGKAIVFEGPEDYHHRIEDPDLGVEDQSVLIIRNCGPVGYPGSAEVVNMQPPAAMLKRGISTLPTMGDGRQSGTSGSPSILNVSPEAAVGGGLALLKTGDRIRIDLNTRKVDVLLPPGELEARRAAWQPPKLVNLTPWEEIYRSMVGQTLAPVRAWKPDAIPRVSSRCTRQLRHSARAHAIEIASRNTLAMTGTCTMQFGIAIPTAADSWRLVRRAEELGFTNAWFFDTQMLSADPFVAMAAAAMKTTRIKLGTGVLIPSNRIAPVAATAFASLNKLAPGRIVFGISTGFTGRRTMGLGAVKLADMEEYIRIVQALWRGETVEMELEGKRRPIRMLNPELGLINTHDPIPLFIAASGPRARSAHRETRRRLDRQRRRCRARRGDIGADAQRLAGSRPRARRPQAVAWIGGAVLEEGEPVDGPRGMALAAPRAAMLLHRAADTALAGYPAPLAMRPEFAARSEAYVAHARQLRADATRTTCPTTAAT